MFKVGQIEVENKKWKGKMTIFFLSYMLIAFFFLDLFMYLHFPSQLCLKWRFLLSVKLILDPLKIMTI